MIDNPPDALREGDAVQLADAEVRTKAKVRMRTGLKPLAALTLLVLQGCSMAPSYKVPSIDLPANYREQTSDGPGTARSRPTNWPPNGGSSTTIRA